MCDETMVHCFECRANHEEIEEEVECAECSAPVLFSENDEAWEIYRRYINRQFVVDFHAFDFIMSIVGKYFSLKMSLEEAMLLVDKLLLIHDVATRTHREVQEREIGRKRQAQEKGNSSGRK